MNRMNSPQYRRSMIIGLILLLAVLSFISGYIANQFFNSSSMSFPLLVEAHSIIRAHYFRSLPESAILEYGMIRGLLQALDDPYTTFYAPAQQELQSNQLEGRFGGIGIRLERDPSNHLLLYPLPNSPAGKAGLQDGDRLLSVDKFIIHENTPLDEVQAAIRGRVGGTVLIKIIRSGESEPRPFRIERTEISVPSVTYNASPISPKIGVIQISVFASTTSNELNDAINQLVSKGSQAIIIDLRNNGGGLIESGIEVCRLFISNGKLIYAEYKDQKPIAYQAKQISPFQDIPLAILVNHNTMSTSEIVAGVLQAHDRAIIIGSQTHGKDTIQLVYKLSDQSSIHITSGRWWLPGFEQEQVWSGVVPDILLEEDQANGSQAQELAVAELLR